IDDIIIYQLVYEFIDSNMFLILEGDEALLVDAHVNPVLHDFLKKRDVKKVSILLTHEHFDHTCGIPGIKENFQSTLICNKNCSEYLSVESNNRPILISYIIIENDRKNGTNIEVRFNDAHKCFKISADVTFEDEHKFIWKGH